MDDIARPLVAGLGNADFLVELLLADLKEEDLHRRARDGQGSSPAWIVGHLLHYRHVVLGVCGQEIPNPYAERFQFTTPATDGDGYPTLEKLQEDWRDVRTRLRQALTGLSADELLAPVAKELPGDGTLAGAIAFFAWHEAYHLGVLGALRVAWGYRHTHELALEARKA